jgi:hypothetical protein
MWFVVAAALTLGAVVSGGLARGVAAAPRQEDTTTTGSTPTLLVPGPGAETGVGGQEGSGGQTGSTTTLVAQSPEEVVEEDEDNTGTIVALVISGLGAVALILALLTFRYWRNTRPAPRT